MYAHDPCFLPLAHDVELTQIQFDLVRFEPAEFRPSETGIDQDANDEWEFTIEQMPELSHVPEEYLQLFWIQAARDPGFWLPHELQLAGRVILDPFFVDRDIEVLAEDLQILVDCRGRDLLQSLRPECLNPLLSDAAHGDLLEVFLEGISPVEINLVGIGAE